jgi:hypothetical protein
MKKYVSIFLLCLFSLAAFVPRMDLDRLYEIPDLAAHFLEHKASDNNTNFIDFIHNHYGKDSQQPSDGHELPFQKHDCSMIGGTVASFLSQADNFFFNFPSISIRTTYTQYFPSLFLSDIWQPPRA